MRKVRMLSWMVASALVGAVLVLPLGAAQVCDEASRFGLPLCVKKNASISSDLFWTWDIEKAVDQDQLLLSPGQTFTATWTVTVSPLEPTGSWTVSGTILAQNFSGAPVVVTSIIDVVDLGDAGTGDDVLATVSCPGLPVTLAAGNSMPPCTYEATGTGAVPTRNTVTVWSSATEVGRRITAIPESINGFPGVVSVTETDECVAVEDDLAGLLDPEVCVGDPDKSFTYSTEIGPYGECGIFQVCNTATFTTNDTGATGLFEKCVDIEVPCEGGCTLTPGYWKTHSIYGPAPYDDTWAMQGEDTPFFLSGQSWYEVLWTEPRGGNAYYILAHAYIAAKLNLLNEADPTEDVAFALGWAEAFFGSYTPSLRLTRDVRAQAIGYAALLDDYNNGITGPGHCSEEQEED